MLNRREFLANAAAVPAVLSAHGAPQAQQPIVRKGRIKQSVCRWCYGGIPLDELCRAAAAIGLKSVELLNENEWGAPAKVGLTCAVANGPGSIADCWNRLENHDRIVKEIERMLPLAKAAGIPNIITFSGNRRGLPDDEGMKNCIIGLKRAAPAAEKAGVTILIELLNSKVDHKDYQCDHTSWGAGVIKAVGSERVKLLYDIYHMQIMEGDVIRTIRENKQYIGHFHTGGVPGRGEIDEAQELNYRAICSAIVAMSYDGYLAQEFCPTRDPLLSLRQAVDICDV